MTDDATTYRIRDDDRDIIFDGWVIGEATSRTNDPAHRRWTDVVINVSRAQEAEGNGKGILIQWWRLRMVVQRFDGGGCPVSPTSRDRFTAGFHQRSIDRDSNALFWRAHTPILTRVVPKYYS